MRTLRRTGQVKETDHEKEWKMDDDNELIGQVKDDNGDNNKMIMVITLIRD